MKLILIRHGYTKENFEKRYIGKTDVSICPEGRDQLVNYAEKGMYPKVDLLFSGPMKRCLETKEVLYPTMDVKIIPELTEMDFGEFECKNFADLRNNKDYQRFIDSNGEEAFPGGESKDDFIKRNQKGFLNLIKSIQSKDISKIETVGLICHGGNIMAILSNNFECGYYDYQCKPGQGYIVTLCPLDGFSITDIEPLFLAMEK